MSIEGIVEEFPDTMTDSVSTEDIEAAIGNYSKVGVAHTCKCLIAHKLHEKWPDADVAFHDFNTKAYSDKTGVKYSLDRTASTRIFNFDANIAYWSERINREPFTFTVTKAV
jgi:hypothetical protein